MSITVYANNSDAIIANELNARFTPEEIEFRNKWINEDNADSWEAYNADVRPIVDKYEVNMNSNTFWQIFENVLPEFEYVGEISNDDVAKLITRLENVLDSGTADDHLVYYINRVLELAKSTNSLHWN
jgi:hypothetical protein